jgi:predicted nucleotidyltransferase component of viral defense system
MRARKIWFSKKYGEIKEAGEKRYTLFFVLSYGKKERNIKIEISQRKFPDSYEVENYLGIPVLVMKKEDMFSYKLVSLLERENLASKDLFDLWYFMKENLVPNKRLLKLRTKMKFKNYLLRCKERIEKIKERYLLQGIGELLDERQKQWLKKNLKKELLFLFNFYIENY